MHGCDFHLGLTRPEKRHFSGFSVHIPGLPEDTCRALNTKQRSVFVHRNRNQRQNPKKPTLPTLFWPKQPTTPVW